MPYKYLFIMLLLTLVGLASGCLPEEVEQAKETKDNATVLATTQILVSQDEAAAAPDEQIEIGNKMAMPCLQFKHSEGFLRWVEAYEEGEDAKALGMAERIHLPEEPEEALIETLRESQVEGALQTSLCGIHSTLNIFTWAVEYADATNIYAYRDPNSERLTVDMAARTEKGQTFTSTTELTRLGLPVCLPKTITNNELIWFCGTPFENWKEVHVNRKLGNMVKLSCEPDENGQPGLGCLDPTAKE
ncbi:hypothetical protein GF391_04330 [Candidatus Uhrbacteria bacterium]|nr:hypothetical protein [Candidatus Uhrbacteria bacterium]